MQFLKNRLLIQIGDFHPSNDELKINAVVKKDAQELIKSTLSFPTMRKQSPKYQAVMDWNYQNVTLVFTYIMLNRLHCIGTNGRMDQIYFIHKVKYR